MPARYRDRVLPNYIVGRDPDLIQLAINADVPSFDTYFCYPDEMKNGKA